MAPTTATLRSTAHGAVSSRAAIDGVTVATTHGAPTGWIASCRIGFRVTAAQGSIPTHAWATKAISSTATHVAMGTEIRTATADEPAISWRFGVTFADVSADAKA